MEPARFLSLETALSGCSVCLAENDRPVAEAVSDIPNSASEVLHRLVDTVLQEAGWTLEQIGAIAVSIGPGSYTGLRIGAAAAKGYAYALKRPILSVSTLQAMAWAAKFRHGIPADRYLPAIDARRNEVFHAIYDTDLQLLTAEAPLLAEEGLSGHFDPALHYCLSGNGASKLLPYLPANTSFIPGAGLLASDLCALAFARWQSGQLADTAFLEPNYTKGFYRP